MKRARDRGVGEVIASRRKLRGYTQEELAKRSGLETRSIGAYERGERRPKGESLARLCVALEVEPEIFLDEIAQKEAGELRPLVNRIRSDMGRELPEPRRELDIQQYSQAWDLLAGVGKDVFMSAVELSRQSSDGSFTDLAVRVIRKLLQTPAALPGGSKPQRP